MKRQMAVFAKLVKAFMICGTSNNFHDLPLLFERLKQIQNLLPGFQQHLKIWKKRILKPMISVFAKICQQNKKMTVLLFLVFLCFSFFATSFTITPQKKDIKYQNDYFSRQDFDGEKTNIFATVSFF